MAGRRGVEDDVVEALPIDELRSRSVAVAEDGVAVEDDEDSVSVISDVAVGVSVTSSESTVAPPQAVRAAALAAVARHNATLRTTSSSR